MHVIDIMSAPVHFVLTSTSAVVAQRMLTTHEISSMPVLSASDEVVGMLSEQDLIRHALRPDGHGGAYWASEDSVVGELMSPAPIAVAPDADVREVAQTFTMVTWKALPVVQHGKLVGMVSRRDILVALGREDRAVQRDVQGLLAASGKPGWTARVHAGVAVVTGPLDAHDWEVAEDLARAVVGVRSVERASVSDSAG